jgi:iron complex transport system ATP-binding protein
MRTDTSLISIRGVSVIRSGTKLLNDVDWHVNSGERWVLLGPNGSGKTTLVSIAATYLRPSRGTVSILGRHLGSVDVRELRTRIGLVSASLQARIPAELPAIDVVVAGATGAIAPWWDGHGRDAEDRAAEMLDVVGCTDIKDRRFELLSSGEKQRVQIARALMLDPALLLLDEPAAGLDLGAREKLAVLLAGLNSRPGLAATVVVTHHVEEIAPGTTHALVLRSGCVAAAGPVAETVTGPVLSDVFGLPLTVHRVGERFAAQARRSSPA